MRVGPKRRRPTELQMIADLEEEMRRVRARIAQRKAKKDPALGPVSAALGSIEKALEASEDSATRQALDEARSTLRAVLSLGAGPESPGGQGPTTPGPSGPGSPGGAGAMMTIERPLRWF
jgi:hypothetical protein